MNPVTQFKGLSIKLLGNCVISHVLNSDISLLEEGLLSQQLIVKSSNALHLQVQTENLINLGYLQKLIFI